MKMVDDTITAPVLQVRSLRKEYRQPDGSAVEALRLDSLEARRGEAIALTGPSGSGKTTLLNALAALIRPTEGEIVFDGRNLNALGVSEAEWRAVTVGYVFQEMNLLPDFSLWENLTLAAEISGIPRRHGRERALSLLERLGLEDRKSHLPRELSLGEQQRAAVARAVLHSPPLLLADEPTASLDAENSAVVIDLLMDMLTELCAKSVLLVATHDKSVEKRFSRVVALQRPEKVKQ
ncbi:MAG: ABC transporter ATP-binding protein [Synergistaceae bacterium]|jgi:putative ABC transport system ATP-binding protein|nr:ABC transporter ATP-binding protein [Synergistaceae bacterium]